MGRVSTETCRYYADPLLEASKEFKGYIGMLCTICKEESCVHHFKNHRNEGRFAILEIKAHEQSSVATASSAGKK